MKYNKNDVIKKIESKNHKVINIETNSKLRFVLVEIETGLKLFGNTYNDVYKSIDIMVI